MTGTAGSDRSTIRVERFWSRPGSVAAPAGVWLDLAGLAVLATALRIPRLNSQLWADEVAALVERFRLPLDHIVSRSPAVAPHLAYDVAAHLSRRLLGEHPWSIRLPAVVFGVAGVLVLYLVVREAGGRGEALLAGGLLTVSYHHVFFSQDARGYTAMLFFALVAALSLVQMPRAFGGRAQAGYVGAAVLCAYSVPFGVGVPLGHAAVALPFTIARRRGGRTPSVPRIVGLFAIAGAITVVLYTPVIRWLLERAATEGRRAGSGGRLSLALVPELVAGLRMGAGGTAVLVAAVLVACLGVVDYARRTPFAFGVLLAPVVATAVALVLFRAGVHPRYLAIALPTGIVFGARGLVIVGRWLAGVGSAVGVRTGRRTASVALALVIGLGAVPLFDYYASPKQDFIGALRLVDRLERPGDRTVAVAIAGHVIDAYYRPGYPTIESVDDLRRLEDPTARVWVITTLERVLQAGQPELVERLHERYRLVEELEGSQEDGQMRVYVGGPGS